MILADTNIWLALALSQHVHHQLARKWFDKPTTDAPIHFCRATQQSFLRLLTTESVMRVYGLPPLTNVDAWAVYEGFRADARIAFAEEPAGVEPRWKRFASRNTTSPKLWMDAYLAAFAAAAGYTLVTADKAFTQFKGLKSIILN